MQSCATTARKATKESRTLQEPGCSEAQQSPAKHNCIISQRKCATCCKQSWSAMQQRGLATSRQESSRQIQHSQLARRACKLWKMIYCAMRGSVLQVLQPDCVLPDIPHCLHRTWLVLTLLALPGCDVNPCMMCRGSASATLQT